MHVNQVPTRSCVRKWWSLLASGAAAREDVHSWAAQWVEGGGGKLADTMVLTGLQYLHGYDMIYDSGTVVHASRGYKGAYIKSEEEIGADLERWIRNCRIYDVDPEGYRAMMKREALKALMDEIDES